MKLLRSTTYTISFVFLAFFSFVNIVHAGIVYRPPNNLGLIGYWSFNEGVGTIATDFSGNGSNGTLTNMESTDWVSGKRGKALDFDGSNEHIVVSSQTVIGALTHDFTVSAWVQADTLSGLMRFFGHSRLNTTNGFAFGVTSAGGLEFSTFGVKDYDSTTITLTAGTWYHVVAVLDSNDDVTFYVNGISRETVTHNAPSVANTDDTFLIGAITSVGSSALTELFDGKIDEVRIYNRSLSGIEITALYRSGLAKIGASQNLKLAGGLAGMWSFNGPDISDSQILDSSGNGNHGGWPTGGTLATSSSKIGGKVGQALDFERDSSDRVVVPNNASLQLTSAVTVSMWIKPESITDYKLLGKQSGANGYKLAIQFVGGATPGSKLEFEIRSATATTLNRNEPGGINFTSGLWYHVVGVFSDADNSLATYVNGVVDRPMTTAETLASGTAVLMIGDSGEGAYFDGIIDEVRVYNRALNAAEIKELYQLGIGTRINTVP